VTLLLAPTYGIAGILVRKNHRVLDLLVHSGNLTICSHQTFHRSVWEYWRGMAPYYFIFALFTLLTIWLKQIVIDPHSDSFISLAFYGSAVIVPLLTFFFILLFQFTSGMKYFVARKPAIYKILNRITF
jgi:hypothetical protein